jgi:hypothetical protein
MALLPWRFQADVAQGETDPRVTVFMGPERSVMDENGEPTEATFVEQSTTDPVQLQLSQLSAALADPSILTGMRKSRKSGAP